MRAHSFALAALLAGCNASEADQLRDQLRDDDYRDTYARAPGWEMERSAAQGGPHGGFIDIYINDVMVEAIEQAEASGEPLERWPEGSIVVKDGWSAREGGELEYLSFMERRDGGWFWGEFTGRGRLVSAGKNDGTCVGCHSAGADQVRAFGLPPYAASE